MHRQQKQGLGRAYLAGFRWALERPEYRFILEMDADFSHDPKAVPQLRAAAQRADLVLGSRYVGGIRVINWPLNRLILSTGAGLYVRLITGMPFTDPTGASSAFAARCWRRSIWTASIPTATRSRSR
jgi:dolichol-phosphate mannosyltransferase